jgi:hypothetical protein
MRIKMSRLVHGLALVVVAAASAQAQTGLVIDDFKDSPYHTSLTSQLELLTAYQTGPNILGGVRQTSIVVDQATPHFGQPTLMQIRRSGSLVISGGYKSYFGIYLGYGLDAAGGAAPLNLNLTGWGGACPGCDRFRIDFDGSDSELNYLVQVFDSDGQIATAYGPESLSGRVMPFHVDFPFADFVQSSARPVDWSRIDYIYVVLQTGNYLGGHDFAVTKVSAIPAPQAVE